MARKGGGVPWWVWLVVGLVVVTGGGAVAVAVLKLSEKQKATRRALREAAAKWDVDPDIMDALGYVESRWNPAAKNEKGPDGARGGSYGPTQLSIQTAEETAKRARITAPTREQLMAPDARIAADWTGRHLAQRPGGPPRTVEDAAAWWNGGKVNAASIPELNKAGKPHPTRVDYIPKALAALDVVKGNPLA